MGKGADAGIDQPKMRCKGGATIARVCTSRTCAMMRGMMITQTALPQGSLIAPYAHLEAHYTDCFEVSCDRSVTLPRFITAFYTQRLFRAERFVLGLVAGARSTDADVTALAQGLTTQFAVWEVSERRNDQVLLVQKGGRTCSWLQAGDGMLRFGSVVVPARGRGGKLTLGPVFHSLLGAHKHYSRALLAGAARKLASV